MLRLLKRQRSDTVEAPLPGPQAEAPVLASQQTPSASSSATSAPATPTAAAAQSRSPAERRDSDEFFTSAIHELDGDDFLLSPQKVTVADINSIAEASPQSSSRQWTRSLRSAAGSSSPPEAQQQQQHQRTRSGSSGGGGSVTRSLFTASGDDQSWLIAAPSGNGRAPDGDFMLEDSPPRRASGRGAASAFAPSPSRIPSGPTQSPSASGGSGHSRIPKPTSEYASPVKADGGGGAGVTGSGGSRIPASPTPSSSSSATRIPGLMSVSPVYAEEQPVQEPVQQYAASPSRLPRGPGTSSAAVQAPPATLEPLRQTPYASEELQPAAQAMEPDTEPAPASPKADTPYSEPYLPQSMLQPQPQPQPQAVARRSERQQQMRSEQPGSVAQQHTSAAVGAERPGTVVGDQRPAKSDDLPVAAAQKPQQQSKPQQQTAAQKDKGCCGCCIM